MLLLCGFLRRMLFWGYLLCLWDFVLPTGSFSVNCGDVNDNQDFVKGRIAGGAFELFRMNIERLFLLTQEVAELDFVIAFIGICSEKFNGPLSGGDVHTLIYSDAVSVFNDPELNDFLDKIDYAALFEDFVQVVEEKRNTVLINEVFSGFEIASLLPYFELSKSCGKNKLVVCRKEIIKQIDALKRLLLDKGKIFEANQTMESIFPSAEEYCVHLSASEKKKIEWFQVAVDFIMGSINKLLSFDEKLILLNQLVRLSDEIMLCDENLDLLHKKVTERLGAVLFASAYPCYKPLAKRYVANRDFVIS